MLETVTREAILYSIDRSLYPTDRFRCLKRYLDSNDEEVPETYERIIFTDRSDDILFRVSSGQVNRLDLIAGLDSIYNNENLWWIIAEANDIFDPFNIPVGTVLKIPSKDKIYSLGGVLG